MTSVLVIGTQRPAKSGVQSSETVIAFRTITDEMLDAAFSIGGGAD